VAPTRTAAAARASRNRNRVRAKIPDARVARRALPPLHRRRTAAATPLNNRTWPRHNKTLRRNEVSTIRPRAPCHNKTWRNNAVPVERIPSSLAPRYLAHFVSAANWTRVRVKNRRKMPTKSMPPEEQKQPRYQ